ncbi:small multi-drug export protein [Antarcticibacterium sp. 1MA-6-2]|uniref:COG2426 family protein n=1 Tax=Antarcticibacterium sp. 1MA-6-2 TaxID=2908210 RepID=UPI001F4665BA|nr:small multi-drug export protein [Antarcticibacterium sp. 1MA-6-2]UJH92182.1 small multi-drug export protein [Antarcticibacterium sp. 1MA-6-2]
MITEVIMAMLWSVSPFGEAKVGIPYAIFNNINIYVAFLVCFLANVLIFPIMSVFLDYINRYFLKWRFYKKSAIYVARKAKIGAGKNVQKYGFWGLLIFVMLPIPGTGVYAGSIAAYLFGIERKRAFLANTIGIFLSCLVVWIITILTFNGMS